VLWCISCILFDAEGKGSAEPGCGVEKQENLSMPCLPRKETGLLLAEEAWISLTVLLPFQFLPVSNTCK